MKEPANYTLWIAVPVCLAAQLVLALLVVPPWQNPDEPQHLHTVRLIALYGSDFVLESHVDDRSEEEIVRSMMEHGWWSYYDAAIPSPAPRTFSEGPARVVNAYFGPPGGGSRLYYSAVAMLFRTLDITGLLAQLYTMRVLSAVWSLLTLVCVWRGTRALLDERSAMVVTALMAVHPQFVIVSTTASPDAFVNLAGAAFWWRAGVMLSASVSAWSVISLWGCALLAVLIRRMGAPLLVIAAAVTLGRLAGAAVYGSRRKVARAAAVIVLAVATIAVAWPAMPDDVHRAFAWLQFDEVQAVAAVAARTDELPRFLEALFTHFWFIAGWTRHQAPLWWYAAVALICGVAVAGLVRRDASPSGTVVALASAMLLLQTLAVIAYHFGVLQAGAQGRYIFPVLPAVFALLWIGWRRWVPPAALSTAAVGLVAAMGLLNALAWLMVVLPVYA
jgi:hypothetical protein